MAARPTMKDVAQAAGVSLMTVSRVVAGEAAACAGHGRPRRGGDQGSGIPA